MRILTNILRNKGVIYALVFIPLAIFGYNLLFTTKKTDTDDLIDDIKVSDLSRPRIYYSSLADRLEAAFKSLGNSLTDELLEELQLLNSDDVKQLYKDFGIRKNTNFGGLQFKYNGDLMHWAAEEVHFDSTRQIFDNMFKKGGLK
ncbi:hypothetical protein QWY31_00530 [Cytophagales bacterium LB-30]|uniref:Uncharacterized protein n=1 Tax=Shiella aurantiaca TaxID=3058365 RepID=A0ABT8F152_9BACT|nr:hypothetical protein [Shiella aurantiaca]MDN4163961.1 hypothetical protein [Shiella aurantiaca]